MSLKNILVIATIVSLNLVACGEQEEEVTAPIPIVEVHNGYQATLAEGIQFAEKPDYPAFIKSVKGMSSFETIGRWTEGKQVAFVFTQNLPAKFTLNLEFAPAFGPDQGEVAQVEVGDWKSTFVASDRPKKVSFLIETATPTDTIKFVVPYPISPAEIGTGEDTRKVGIMFKRLSIVTDESAVAPVPLATPVVESIKTVDPVPVKSETPAKESKPKNKY